MSSSQHYFRRQARTSDRHAARAGAHRRAHRRGFCRRSAAHPGFAPAARMPTSPDWAARSAATTRSSICQKRPEAEPRAWPPGCGMPASRPTCSKAASKPGARPAAAGAAGEAAAARRARPHRLGDALAAEGRPHRLPVADPPLRRSAARSSCSSRRPRWRRWPSASTRRRSTSRACSGAIAASAAPSTS